MHGPSFALMWSAGVACANRLAPPGMGATAQGLFSGVNFGLAGACGALAGGVLLDYVSPAAMYGCAGGGLLAALSVLLLAGRRVQLEGG